jgi:predicted permease
MKLILFITVIISCIAWSWYNTYYVHGNELLTPIQSLRINWPPLTILLVLWILGLIPAVRKWIIK